jgi:hypothetical protein
MNDSNRLDHFAPILKHYQIDPYFIEDFGKLLKVYSNKGTFALKKSLHIAGRILLGMFISFTRKGITVLSLFIPQLMEDMVFYTKKICII